MDTKIKLVCFDLGGVLAHIAHSWPEAMRAAGLHSTLAEDTPLSAAPTFDLYQAGKIDTETYVKSLADFLQVSEAEAMLAHDHILLRPTENTLSLVEELHSKGITTACLSNTNDLHWDELSGPRFPNINILQKKFASQELGLAKPDHAIYRKFEELTGTPGEEILFFEDTVINVQGAREVGWNVVQINPRANQFDQINAAFIEYGIR